MTGNGPVFVPSFGQGHATAARWRPTAPLRSPDRSFFQPAAGTSARLQRNYFSGPWVWNMDFSAAKTVKFTRRRPSNSARMR